jgi:FKBP-type peptidyl-prolyl cis-trans isomerase SlyD
MLIGNNSVVSFHYELTNDAGEVLDASPDSEPLTYLHGAGNIIPGLESQMIGKTVGAEFRATVQPEQGYGVRQPHLVQEVPKSAFPNPDQLEPGMRFSAQSDQGTMSVVVSAVSADTVTVDANHPLAGETLHFAVRIADVRDATDEEVAHGHAHMPGHHHH